MEATTAAVIGAACAAIGCGITILAFWTKFENRLTHVESAAEQANREADAASKLASEAHNRITLQSAEFGQYREVIAREYIHRDAMREIEDRLTAAIERLGDRLDSVLTLSKT